MYSVHAEIMIIHGSTEYLSTRLVTLPLAVLEAASVRLAVEIYHPPCNTPYMDSTEIVTRKVPIWLPRSKNY